MKSKYTLPILSGIALAVMAGAATSHHFTVDKMVAFAGMTRANGLPSSKGGPARLVSNDTETRKLIENLRLQNNSLQHTLKRNEAAISAIPMQVGDSSGDIDYKRLLAELVTQNRALTNQVAETNRDIMNLQFQVDTHSKEFRPLNAIDDDVPVSLPDIDNSIGLLPPTDL